MVHIISLVIGKKSRITVLLMTDLAEFASNNGSEAVCQWGNFCFFEMPDMRERRKFKKNGLGNNENENENNEK